MTVRITTQAGTLSLLKCRRLRGGGLISVRHAACCGRLALMFVLLAWTILIADRGRDRERHPLALRAGSLLRYRTRAATSRPWQSSAQQHAQRLRHPHAAGLPPLQPSAASAPSSCASRTALRPPSAPTIRRSCGCAAGVRLCSERSACGPRSLLDTKSEATAGSRQRSRRQLGLLPSFERR